MNQIFRIRTVILLGLPLGLVLFLLGWAAPAQADGGGWLTATPTLTQTSTTAASPIDSLLTPEPAVIVPDTGEAAISFEDELATVQAEAQQTADAQKVIFIPTATPEPQSGGVSTAVIFGGLVATIVLLGVLLYFLFRGLRR